MLNLSVFNYDLSLLVVALRLRQSHHLVVHIVKVNFLLLVELFRFRLRKFFCVLISLSFSRNVNL